MNNDMALEEALKRLFDARDKWVEAGGRNLEFWKHLNALCEAELKKRQAPPREPLSERQIREMQAHECQEGD